MGCVCCDRDLDKSGTCHANADLGQKNATGGGHYKLVSTNVVGWTIVVVNLSIAWPVYAAFPW